MRNVLVTALVDYAESPCRSETRRFLDGLSSDELQYIAEFYGACIVESGGSFRQARLEIEARLATRSTHRRSPDLDHKMILLREYLARAGTGQKPRAQAAGA